MAAKLVTADSVRSVGEVEQDALRVAAVLRGRGVAPGDRVVLKADNSAGYVTALLALVHLDVSIVLVDHRQTPEETLRFAGLARARWAVLEQALPLGDVGALHLDELLAEAAARPEDVLGALSFVDWFSRTDALIAWSSGTTGEPKGIVRSGNSFLGNIERTQLRMRYTEADVLMPLLPFSHQYGLSLVLLWWVARCSFVVAPYARLDHAVDMAGRYGVSVVDATPATYHTMLNLLRRRPEFATGLRGVRMWCVGGAPLDRALADKFIDATGQPLLDGYGSTELGNIALATPDNPVGCGKPLDGVDLQIINEHGVTAAPGEIGEILVRSGGLMQGYLAADGSVTPRGNDTYRTNDIGYRDAEGNVYVVGRKFAVHRMGHTLYPEALARKAEVVGAPIKVVALDDERRGSQLVFVVADPELREARHWRELICAELPPFEQPNQVLVLAEFPLNANGKPDPRQLEQLVIEALPGAKDRLTRPAAEPAPDLSAIHYPERVRAVNAVLDFLRTQRPLVEEVLTEISNHKAVQEEIEATISALEGAVEEISTYRPGQVDKMAVFMSSNVLLYSYALYLLIPSLYAEEIIFRPSSQVGDTTRRLHELLTPVHGLETIELTTLSQRQFVEVPVAEADVLVFTGAYQNAELVRSELRDDQMLLFFGQGVNPFIVAPEADVDLAVTDALRIRMVNSGQDCFGPDVFMVHASQAERFTDQLVKRVADLRYGTYTDTEADYSSLCYDTALEAAADYLRTNREHIVQGGRVDFRSRHVEPTVLVRRYNKKMPIEETFSPIFNVVVYENAQQLKSFINSPIVNERAMAAMIYGEDQAATELLAKRHAVCANMTIFEVENGNKPFGGHGVAASYIAYRGERHAEPILISKAVAEHLPAAKQSRMANA